MKTSAEPTEILNDLIEINNDRIKGYESNCLLLLAFS